MVAELRASHRGAPLSDAALDWIAAFHAASVCKLGGLTVNQWLGQFRLDRTSFGATCSRCSAPTRVERYRSRLYQGYARELQVCAREGIVADASDALAAPDMSVDASGRVGDSRSLAVQVRPRSARPVRVTVALEHHGEDGRSAPYAEASGAPVEFSLPAARERGMHSICAVALDGADYAYRRALVEL